ncbi:putative oxidoreductase GLYR1 homolog [Eurytemora carolleeae]|uniref:putative oxidoreductase GLYR1 homolog n=1 Tax=Eurytemora carolleeae TaxID=1294199 RepID=UPI000C770387|nr:putative oxidoreductase GLYR1 homolog [Eurytemora carolleeae]|eukprot:XP_023344502.1 putative oxidoreductase GLYR1 homolog [Eurytemora affinis]
MSSEQFKFRIGDPVWAKMKGFSPWPGVVVMPHRTNSRVADDDAEFDALISGKQSVKKSAKKEAGGRKRNISEDSGSTASGPSSSTNKKPRGRPPLKQKVDDSSERDASPVPYSSSKKAAVSGLLDRPSVLRPASPALGIDLVTSSQTLREKDIQPSKLNFGFLGLGIMGSGMVKNLLNSGHQVTVWNRTTDKVKDFVEAGAKEALTPSDVIAECDITFSCVSDPQAAKDLVFGNCGVLQEINTTKGYVEMTSVDSDTSQDIAEAISLKGGRYLEAQIQGSKCQAQDGTLVVLVAGDRSLFDDCQSCFQAIGKNSFYLGEVGNASKMNLVLQTMIGVTLAGLAEGMALADRAGLQQKDVMEVLELTGLNCPAILQKGKAIIDGGFPTHQPLQHMQKDLKLSLNMGDQLEQPLPLTASANEVFKHAKRLGYGEHDVSAVYIRARF